MLPDGKVPKEEQEIKKEVSFPTPGELAEYRKKDPSSLLSLKSGRNLFRQGRLVRC